MSTTTDTAQATVAYRGTICMTSVYGSDTEFEFEVEAGATEAEIEAAAREAAFEVVEWSYWRADEDKAEGRS